MQHFLSSNCRNLIAVLILVLLVCLAPSACQAQYPLVQVRLVPNDPGNAEKISKAISEHAHIDNGAVDSTLAAVLGRGFEGRAEVTIFWERRMDAYAYARQRAVHGKSVAVLAVRDAATLDFQHHTEFKAFWRDTIAVVDSLMLGFSRLPGARPGTMKVMVCSSSSGPVDLSSRAPGAGEDPMFVLSQASLDYLAKQGPLCMSCTENPQLSGQATVHFLDVEERAKAVEVARLLHDKVGLRKAQLVDQVVAYLKLWHGTPVRANVQQFLRTEQLMDP